MIGQYRKRPVVIEASDPITGENFEAIAAWCHGLPVVDDTQPGVRVSVKITTLEGTMTGDEGDRVIRGVQGEFYPCKPDIFDATYEAAS